MDVSRIQLVDFLEGNDKRFVIPVYQRNYDWKKDNCKQLWDDLLDVQSQGRKLHFFGYIVSLDGVNINNEREISIIDGQQRITTISLLLLAMVHLIQEHTVNDLTIKSYEILDTYLRDKQSGKIRLKLKQIKGDDIALNNLFENTPNESEEGNNIIKNYSYFKYLLCKLPNNLHFIDILDSIKKLQVIGMNLSTAEDNPQLIFESLNSTGLGLLEADKVRNYLLMNLARKTQQDFYEKYWNQIEIRTGYNVSAFLKDYFTFKKRRAPNINKVYFVFKEYVQENPWGISDEVERKETFLKELLLYAGYYEKISKSSHKNIKINEYLKYINNLDTHVVYPFLLEIFKYNDNNVLDRDIKLSDDELREILTVLVSFIVRRFICGVPTSQLNKLFMTLGKDIEQYKPHYIKEYVNTFKYELAHKIVHSRFPTDAEFREKMLKEDIYHMKAKNKMHIFQLLEDYDHRSDDLEKMLKEGRIQIEHIMPQKLNEAWEKDLGEDYAKIHDEYLHTIGNLTFTLYNKELSNKSFLDKKNLPHGIMESKFSLNDFVRKQNIWNKETILKRANILIDKAIKIWKYPEFFEPSSPKSKTRDLYTFGLDDDIDFTWSEICMYSMSGRKKIPVIDCLWSNFYEEILKHLYSLDREKFREYLKNNDFLRNSDFAMGIIGTEEEAKEKLFGRIIEIDDDVFLEGTVSAKQIISNTKKMFDKLGISYENIKLYIKWKEEKEIKKGSRKDRG
jgi:uncharacterized protein with ParB-like and HNH nuclease domain